MRAVVQVLRKPELALAGAREMQGAESASATLDGQRQLDVDETNNMRILAYLLVQPLSLGPNLAMLFRAQGNNSPRSGYGARRPANAASAVEHTPNAGTSSKNCVWKKFSNADEIESGTVDPTVVMFSGSAHDGFRWLGVFLEICSTSNATRGLWSSLRGSRRGLEVHCVLNTDYSNPYIRREPRN